MAYYDLDTFSTNQLLPADFMNRLVENIGHFRTPPQYIYNRGLAESNYTTASTTFVDIDSTNMSPTLVFTGNPVQVILRAGKLTLTGIVTFTLAVDGVDITADAGLWQVANTNNAALVTYIVTGLTPGNHTIKPLWKSASGTATLFSANAIQYVVREL